jgi:DNA-binding MarR family transcriptional regulator
VLISVTPLGREALDAVTRRRRSEVAGVLAAMSERDRADAVRVMQAFDAAAQEDGDAVWPVEDPARDPAAVRGT